MSNIRPRISFAEMTAPLEPQRFLEECWTRRATHLRSDGRRFDDYFGWPALETVLNAGDLTFPKVKMSRSDQPVPAEEFTVDAGGQRLVDGAAVLRLLHDGASVGITGADSHWPPLRAVVDCIYDALLESVHTNVYCSPANTQGFQCHFDLHEVLVLQIAGEKHWRVYLPTTESPVQSWRAADSPHLTSEPYLDVILRPGDVLYVPRGHWHYAVARDSTSLHVTVGMTCRKATAFLDWLTGELLEEAVWRRNVPLLADAAVGGLFTIPRGANDWSEDLRRSLAARLAQPDLFERFFKAMLGSASTVHSASLLDEHRPIEDCRFERPPGRRHYYPDGFVAGAPLTITVAGAEIEVDAGDADLLVKIFAAESFTLADIRAWKPDVAIDEVVALLGELTRSGFLLARF